MKSLNEFINESLNIEINESILNKVSNFYHRVIKNEQSITDILNMIRKELRDHYDNFGVEIKKASDVIKDLNCATLNIKKTTYTIISKEAPGIFDWTDFLGYSNTFIEYYKENPDLKVICIYDKKDPKHVYSIMDLCMFNFSESKWRWSNELEPKAMDAYIEHCMREIAAYNHPDEFKGGRTTVGSTKVVPNF